MFCKIFIASLNQHPKEAVIVQVKRDGNLPSELTNAGFATSFFALTMQKSQYWRIDAPVPKLKDAQGKIQLIRRFDVAGKAPIAQAGLDVTPWDRTSGWDRFTITASQGNSGADITRQDH